jgi:hypothetical protein
MPNAFARARSGMETSHAVPDWGPGTGRMRGVSMSLVFSEIAPVTALRMAAALPLGRKLVVGNYLRTLCAPLLRTLIQAELRLAPEVRRAEREFLTLGEQLAKLSDICSSVVRKGERLLVLATGQEQAQEAVAATVQLLETPLAYLARLPGEAADAACSAGRAAAAARSLLILQSALARAMDPLPFLATLLHIESARLPSDVRQMFSALNAEIEGLQRRVRDQFSTKFIELRRMLTILSTFEVERKEQQTVIEAKGEQARRRLRSSFHDLQASIAENAERNAGLAHMVGELSAGVDRMVVAMQTHDMFSQRIGHVRHALDGLHSEFDAFQYSTLGEMYARLPKLAATAELQSAQVGAATEQLVSAADELKSTIDQVLDSIHQLDDDCLILRGFQNVTAAANGTIQVLLDSMDDSSALVEESAAAAENYFQALEPLGQLAASLAGDIESAGQEMHRIALNTQLIAVQRGAGTGLEALAATMAATAGEVSRICESADRGVTDLTANLTEVIRAFGDIMREGQSIRRQFDDGGENHRNSLHASRDAVLDAWLDLSRTSEDAQDLARQMRSVDLSRLCDYALPEIQTVLAAVGKRMECLCTQLRTGAMDPDDLEALRAQYTMRSERLVHSQAVSSNASSSAEASESEFGSDIELF